MPKNYKPVLADEQLQHDVRAITRLAIAEDLGTAVDWTTVCLVDDEAETTCQIRSRGDGIAAGLIAIPWVISEFDAELKCKLHVADGQPFAPETALATITGNARDMLTTERTILNLVSRMCGIATLASKYVAAVQGTAASVYDTRKTTPGWRRIEKYSVRCGGAMNHRTGLFDGILIKDNHIALSCDEEGRRLSLVQGVQRAIQWRGGTFDHHVAPEMVEVEVDTLEQFDAVLPLGADIILLDNFSIQHLRTAVERRNSLGCAVQLEASGNVRIDTIGEIASTGVERISSGALTHQATSLDLGLDWIGPLTREFDGRDKNMT